MVTDLGNSLPLCNVLQAALLLSQLRDTHTHDDSDVKTLPEVSLSPTLSPEQMPSLSVTDTTALQFQIAFAVSL